MEYDLDRIEYRGFLSLSDCLSLPFCPPPPPHYLLPYLYPLYILLTFVHFMLYLSCVLITHLLDCHIFLAIDLGMSLAVISLRSSVGMVH